MLSDTILVLEMYQPTIDRGGNISLPFGDFLYYGEKGDEQNKKFIWCIKSYLVL